MNTDTLKRRRELRRQVVEDLIESLPRMELTPLPEKFLKEILTSGLVILGGRGTGKTNAGMVIISQIIKDQNSNIQCKLVDSCQNLVHKFEPIYYQHLNEDTLLVKDKLVWNNIYFGGDHFLYDIELWEPDLLQDVIGMLVATDYDIQRMYKKHGEMNDSWILWLIEESQNILGTYALTGKQGKRWLRLISESRNFNMNFIFIGQRGADISTKAIERCSSYLLAKMTGDNDLKKVQRICGKNSGVHEILPTLELGEFIHWNGEEATKVYVPKYEVSTRPVLWKGGSGI